MEPIDIINAGNSEEISEWKKKQIELLENLVFIEPVNPSSILVFSITKETV
jgi:hypothetical protein